MRKPWLKWGVLWFGLMLCFYALWHARMLAGDAIARVGLLGWMIAGLLLAASWSLSVASWRGYLFAYTNQKPTWRTSARQVGLLLVGKYVPGGIFGFLARLYDQQGVQRGRLFWAGLAEQAVGVVMPLVLGGVLYLTAAHGNLIWTGLLIPLPFLMAAMLSLLHRLSARLPWLRSRAATSNLPGLITVLPAVAMQLGQQSAWVALVAVLARELYQLDVYAALGVAGAFWWAVALGVLAVLMPGGIGVREAAMVALASFWLDAPRAILLSALLRLLSSLLDVAAGGIATMLAKNRREEAV